jgi:RNA polymerase sigma-70 factor (ECF subfamily)
LNIALTLKGKTRSVEKSIEQIIIERCRNGEAKYQEMLYKHFYGYAFSISRLHTYDHEETIDIMNDSFLKVFKSIKKYDSAYPFKAWLKKIIVNTAIDQFRKKSKNSLNIYVEDYKDAQIISEVNENVIDNLNAQDILKLLDSLPQVHRQVFSLYEIQGYTHKEIAKSLKIKESSSRTFLTRAKNKIKTLILSSNGYE